jgi:hypothetical protein
MPAPRPAPLFLAPVTSVNISAASRAAQASITARMLGQRDTDLRRVRSMQARPLATTAPRARPTGTELLPQPLARFQPRFASVLGPASRARSCWP